MLPGQQWSAPIEQLRPYVRVFAQRNVDATKVNIVSAVPARVEQLLNFEFKENYELHFEDGSINLTPQVSVVGPSTHRRCDTVLNAHVDSFGIFFQPSGFSRLFGHPAHTIVDRYYEASPLVGKSLRQLRHRLGETRSFEARVRIAEAFLLRLASRIRLHAPMMDAADHILAVRGVVTMGALAGEFGMGLRQFERRFSSAIGYAPKLHARIARFQTALDMKVRFPDKKWRDIAHTLQYHDQMHMVHDFEKLGGAAPTQLLVQARDQRPPALILEPD